MREMPYKGGRYVPPVRDEDESLLTYSEVDRNSLAYYLRSGQLAMGVLMAGFIFLAIHPSLSIVLCIVALIGGAYARSHGGYVGTATMMLAVPLMVIAVVMWAAHVTLLPWD